jgi:exopolysaccharide biosynthesis WecB/TagA/CpsF family protein
MFASGGQPAQSGPELRVNMLTMQGTLATIVASARARQGFTLFTVNLDHVVKLNQSGPFREAYQRANYITADGWPIVWLARGQDRRRMPRAGSPDRRRTRPLERTTGADLLEPMCREAAKHGLPLYFIGPGPQSQQAGLEILKQRYPELIVAGTETPSLGPEFDSATVDALAERLAASKARVCIVSLGAPKQELLADALHRRCPDVGFLCVGAALDFISGHAVRAPAFMQRIGMEWFWRMVSDPKRLALRYLGCGIAFLKLCLPDVFRRTARLVVADQEAVFSEAPVQGSGDGSGSARRVQ